MPRGTRAVAEGEGFEPPVGCPTAVFKTAAISQTLPPLRAGPRLHRRAHLARDIQEDITPATRVGRACVTIQKVKEEEPA